MFNRHHSKQSSLCIMSIMSKEQQCEDKVPIRVLIMDHLGRMEAYYDYIREFIKSVHNNNIDDTEVDNLEATQEEVSLFLDAAAKKLGLSRPFSYKELQDAEIKEIQSTLSEKNKRVKRAGRGGGGRRRGIEGGYSNMGIRPRMERVMDDILTLTNRHSDPKIDAIGKELEAQTFTQQTNNAILKLAQELRAGKGLKDDPVMERRLREQNEVYEEMIIGARNLPEMQELQLREQAQRLQIQREQARLDIIRNTHERRALESARSDERTATPEEARILGDSGPPLSWSERIGWHTFVANYPRVATFVKVGGSLSAAALVFTSVGEIWNAIKVAIHGDGSEKLTQTLEALKTLVAESRENDGILSQQTAALDNRMTASAYITSAQIDALGLTRTGDRLLQAGKFKLLQIGQAQRGKINIDSVPQAMWDNIRLTETDLVPSWKPEIDGAIASYNAEADTIEITIPVICPSVGIETATEVPLQLGLRKEITEKPIRTDWDKRKKLPGRDSVLDKKLGNYTETEKKIKQAENAKGYPVTEILGGTLGTFFCAFVIFCAFLCYKRRNR